MIKKPNDAIAVEMWYLSKNRAFQKDVQKIRERFQTKRPRELTVEEWGLFKDMMFEIHGKSRFSKSKRDFETIQTLQYFIFYNEIAIEGISPKPLPNHKISLYKNKVRLTFYLDYDAKQKEVRKLLKMIWKHVRTAQKKLNGEQFKDSTNFSTDSKVWEMHYEEDKNIENITENELMERIGYSKDDIKRLFKRMNTRIKSSYKSDN